MTTLALLVYIHILLMVFWLGTDIGVFVAGLRFIDPQRPIPERYAVMNLGMVVDRYPRICFVANVPVGLQLASSSGFMPVSTTVMASIWILSSIWMSTVVAGMILFGTARVRSWQRVERGFLTAGVIVFAAWAFAGWTGRLPMPGWVAGKLAAYGAMCLFALLLEHSFAPVFGAFGAIATDGSTPVREAALRSSMIKTYVWVVAIYAAVLVCGFLGTVKP